MNVCGPLVAIATTSGVIELRDIRRAGSAGWRALPPPVALWHSDAAAAAAAAGPPEDRHLHQLTDPRDSVLCVEWPGGLRPHARVHFDTIATADFGGRVSVWRDGLPRP